MLEQYANGLWALVGIIAGFIIGWNMKKARSIEPVEEKPLEETNINANSLDFRPEVS